MRILYFANNWLGWKVLAWLRGQGNQVVGLVVHPQARRKFGAEILEAAGLDSSHVIDAAELELPETRHRIHELRPDIGVSVLFGYVLRKWLIESFPRGCVNLHPSFLPYNRGANPNIWSIVEKTPAGTTLHYIDEGIDTGAIIAQKHVKVEPIDTGKTLYHKLEQASLELFCEQWPLIQGEQADFRRQATGDGTSHKTRDLKKIEEIDLSAQYKAEHLIDMLRAQTFPPYKGAWFERDGRKVYIRVELEYGSEDQAAKEEGA